MASRDKIKIIEIVSHMQKALPTLKGEGAETILANYINAQLASKVLNYDAQDAIENNARKLLPIHISNCKNIKFSNEKFYALLDNAFDNAHHHVKAISLGYRENSTALKR